jgi:hypothetical protein
MVTFTRLFTGLWLSCKKEIKISKNLKRNLWDALKIRELKQADNTNEKATLIGVAQN